MIDLTATADQAEKVTPVTRTRARRRADRRFGWGSRIALAVMGLILLCAIVPGLLAPYSPIAQDISVRLSGPTAQHLLGTDSDGREHPSAGSSGAHATPSRAWRSPSSGPLCSASPGG